MTEYRNRFDPGIGIWKLIFGAYLRFGNWILVINFLRFKNSVVSINAKAAEIIYFTFASSAISAFVTNPETQKVGNHFPNHDYSSHSHAVIYIVHTIIDRFGKFGNIMEYIEILEKIQSLRK